MPDWVKNGGFDLADIQRTRRHRRRWPAWPSSTTGLQLRSSTSARGSPRRSGATGRSSAPGARFERDAWIDGFTDTTWFGGGGTNYQGWQLGGQYAFDRRTTVGLRATSSRSLGDGESNLSSAPLKVETLQLDLNTRF
jgi:hypothetical protein